ncbi:MAG: alpha-L-fucosidase, partial [Terriglobia bacterium]
FYNAAARRGQEVALTYKNDAYPEHAAVLDIERGIEGGIRELHWQTDTSVSWKSWGFIEDDSYKSAAEIVPELVDIVSKNGNLLLNVGPRPDGTIPEQAANVFRSIGRWVSVGGEAIFGTRPWKIYGEGPNKLKAGSFGEKQVTFTSQDIRFTTKGNTIYAIFLGWPEHEARVTALGAHSQHAPAKISGVALLGSEQNLKWRQNADALVIETPEEKPCDFAFAFKITLGASA